MTQPPADLFEPAPPPGAADRAAVVAVLAAHGASRFVGWDLTGADLSDLELAGCAFVRCRAGRAGFGSADLTEARFMGCDLNNTRWRGARLAAARLTDCKLTGAQFHEVSGLGLTFERCLLVNAYLRGVSFRKTELDALDLQGADLAGCFAVGIGTPPHSLHA